MGKLDGKAAIVTGASRGIGAEIARLLAAEGARVICAARTVREGDHPLAGSLEHTVGNIRETGGEATPVPVNLSLPEDCEKLVQETRAIYGPVDLLVNNAALTYFIPIKEYPLNRWIRSWAVNVHAPFLLSKLVLEDMIPRSSGAIVNISSGAAIGPGRGPYDGPVMRGATLYGAEKAALERFSQGLAAEVYDDGVVVTCLSPSLIVPTPGVVHHRLLNKQNQDQTEPPEHMARAALLLVTEPREKVAGRVTYSQQILQEFGWIEKGRGLGFERSGSGYSKI